jgi:hypothetical protein
MKGIITFSIMLLASVVSSTAQSSPAPSESEERRFRRVYNFSWPEKPTRDQRDRLAPRQEELEAFRPLLETPSTGIFRLRPDIGCFRNPAVLRADEKCADAIPGSSHYSFRRKRYMPEALSDIRLQNGFIVSDGALAQSVMVRLGDLPVEGVGFQTPGLGFLREYSPSDRVETLQNDFVRFFNGVEEGGFEYRVAHRAEVGITYALRVVALRGSIYRQTTRGFRYDVLADDTRIDILVVFRVVHRDDDGTLTLVFRELERKRSPRIRVGNRR